MPMPIESHRTSFGLRWQRKGFDVVVEYLRVQYSQPKAHDLGHEGWNRIAKVDPLPGR